MSDVRMTNWLLAGILVVLLLQMLGRSEPVAHADTFLIDNCVTSKPTETPQQYLHVVTHAPPK